MNPRDACLSSVGIGWRHPHHARLLAERPALGFIEVHSENFFAAGGAARATLRAGRAHYPVSLHGVGLALGSAAGLDAWHLDRLADLVAEIDPVRVSDHASFARAPREAGGPVLHANDLLPVARTEAGLQLMVRHVQQVQERLRRPLAIENLSAYLQWQDDEMDEGSFFHALVRRSGCRVLLDVNNLVVNALNAGSQDPVALACAWVDAMPAEAVDEIHLAGHARTETLVIDDHGSRVPPAVWAVYRHALQGLGPRPTLIEWDTDLPELEVLLEEAGQATTVMATVASGQAAGVSR